VRPIASFSAMFVWAILLIAVVGIAVSLTQGAWAPTVAWAIVASAAAAGLIRLRHRQIGSTRTLRAVPARRIHRAKHDKNDHI
jgi:hypothetical protein